MNSYGEYKCQSCEKSFDAVDCKYGDPTKNEIAYICPFCGTEDWDIRDEEMAISKDDSTFRFPEV